MDYMLGHIILLIIMPLVNLNIIIFKISELFSLVALVNVASIVAYILHVESAIKGYKVRINKLFILILLINLATLILGLFKINVIDYRTGIEKIYSIKIDVSNNVYFSNIMIVNTISTIWLIVYLLKSYIKNIKISYTIKQKELYSFWVFSYCIILTARKILVSLYYFGVFNEDHYEHAFIITRIIGIISVIFLFLNPTVLNYIPGIKDGAIFKRVTKKNYFSIIEKVIENQKLYLKPRLTVNDITIAIGISEKDISAAILLKTKYNFNDYINKYRIDTATKLIHQKFLDSHTTVALGEKCGFNSHQSFFRAFKKNKNTTPKEYDFMHNERI